MFGPEKKSKILKNKNGDTSLRTKSNPDPLNNLTSVESPDSKNYKKES